MFFREINNPSKVILFSGLVLFNGLVFGGIFYSLSSHLYQSAYHQNTLILYDSFDDMKKEKTLAS